MSAGVSRKLKETSPNSSSATREPILTNEAQEPETRMPRPPFVPLLAVAAAVLAAALSACSSPGQLTVSYRQVPKSEARIVVLPVGVPAAAKELAGSGPTLAALYATELLRSYRVLEWKRFERTLAERDLDMNVLLNGTGGELAKDLGVDAMLVSEVYEWKPGKPGILFLAKKGQVGFQARLVDVATGSVLWSVNRVQQTEPGDTLPVGLARVFRELSGELPHEITPY